jgi:hypothetical protein
MAKYREPIPPGRTPAWLTEFKREILEYKAAGLTYAQIWDALAKRYPFVPQFAEFTEPKDKTSRIAVFLARHPTRTPRQRTEPNKANKTNGASND